MEGILKFDDVTFGYPERKDILKNITYEFKKGIFYTIVGPSGSGKTTALIVAGALDSPQNGSVLFNGENIKKVGYSKHRQKNVGLVFQSYNLIKYMSAIENVIMAMEIAGVKRKDKKQYAEETLVSLGLDKDEMKRNIMRLSGGQQQRVAIARALATDAPIILADEPTGNLDANTSNEIIDIFIKLAKEHNKCVIVVTHSNEVSKKSDVVLKLENGKFV